MPEETEIGEVGVDKLDENAREKAHEHGQRAPWLRWLALSTALFAVVAAVAALKSGHFANEALVHINEATLRQAQASDKWSYYQAKGIKSVVRDSTAELLEAQKYGEAATKMRAEAERYKHDQEETSKNARELEAEQKKLELDSHHDLERHQSFAIVVTTLQVAIGLSAVAALIERRSMWLVALLAGAAGMILFALNMLKGG
ncbi:MAG: hypothetical protein NVS3B20_17550 [Polyangiales bacterium]